MTLRNWIAASAAELGDLITSLESAVRGSIPFRTAQSTRTEPRRALDLAQLEDRVMLSASPAVMIGELAGVETFSGESFDLHDAPDVQLATTADGTGLAAVQRGEGDVEEFEQALIRELVIVDTATPDYQQLVDDLLADNKAGRTFEVVLLDADRDGIEQISDVLGGYDNLNAVHLISHGTDGQVNLGNTWLSLDNVGAYAGQLVGWRDALADDADLLFYGCDLAGNEEGKMLVESFSTLCDCDVAASTDDTGHATYGGDWDLEYTSGQIETAVAFSGELQQNWDHLLNISVNSTSSAVTPTSDTSLTWSHTVNSGTDRVLTIGMSLINGQSTSVTYDGNPLTLVGRHIGAHTVEIWQLVNPDVGTANVVANFSGSLEAIGGAATYNGVDPTTPTGTFQGAGGDSGTASVVVSSAPGELVIDTLFVDLNVTATVEAGQTEQWNQTNDRLGAGSTEAGAASVTMSWDLSPGEEWDIGAVALKPSNPTLVVDTATDVRDGDTSSISALLGDKGADGFISLREAIEATNATPNAATPDRIEFSIGTGLQTIVVNGPSGPNPNGNGLDWIDDPVIIDATTQPGYAGSPLIELDGSGAAGSSAGLWIRTSDSTVRGFIVHSFPDEGIEIDGSLGPSDNNVVQNNWVGIDALGAAAPSGDDGILITDSASFNLIGGAGANDGNVISANASFGIQIRDNLVPGTSDNVIQGNYIGTNVAGTAALGNTLDSIRIDDSANNTIGGTTAAHRNIISGSTDSFGDGIDIRGVGSTGTIIQGNYVGTDVTGNVDLGNTKRGIYVRDAADTQIGGTAAGAGNVISGNDDDGIHVLNATATGTIIEGNIIGLNAAGTVALGNGADGIDIRDGADGAQIGGTTAAARNVISANGEEGVQLGGVSGVSNIVVEGNYIGTDISGTLARGNAGAGVLVYIGSTDNTVGGTTAGAANIIANSGQAGVIVRDATTTDNAIQGNAVYANVGLGIDLGDDGVTGNDAGDGDTGPNDLRNFPVLTKAATDGTNITLAGTLDSAASTTFDIDFYASATQDGSGYGEAEQYLGATTVTTDGSGYGRFHITLSAAVPVGYHVTATTTDPSGNTSEFSANLIAYSDAPSLWLSTRGDVASPSTPPGLDKWTDGEVLDFGAPGLTLESPSTAGTFSSLVNFDAFAADNDVDLSSLHYVHSNITLGGDTQATIDLFVGDLLFSTELDEDLTSSNSVSTHFRDVWIFRPDTPGDYTAGTFIELLDNVSANRFRGVSLVEETTDVGDATLTAGTFIFAQDGTIQGNKISHFTADDVGTGTTLGTTTTLIDGDDISMGDTSIRVAGIELVENDITVGGRALSSGNILVTMWLDDASVGNGTPITTELRDVFYLDVTTTGVGTTDAAATLLFDGSDVGLLNTQPDISAIALHGEISNQSPTLTLPGGPVSYTENDPATVIDGGATLIDADSVDFDTGTLAIDYTANGTTNDRLEIRDQGPGVGNISLLGSDVRYDFGAGPIVIGTFTGGTGLTPLVITLNANSDDPSVEALMQNITYRNVSEDPSTPSRTVRFVLTDGDGGNSNAETEIINVASANDPSTLAAIEGGPLAYSENDPATAITASLTVSDVDDTNIESATVQITGNYASGQDVLAFVDTPSITGSWNAISGTMTLTGSDTLANYELALRTVTYQNTSDSPSVPARTVSFTVNDGDDPSNIATRNINVTAVNDDPTAAAGSVVTNEDVPYVFVAADFNFADVDAGDSLNQIRVSALPTVGSLELSGVPVILNQVISVGDINAGNLAFVPVADQNGASYDGFDFEVHDGTTYGVAAYTMDIDVTAVNDAPTIDFPPLQNTPQDSPLVLNTGNGNLITLGDVDLAAGQLEVTLSVGNGDLTLNGTTGLSFSTGDGTADSTMVFTGTVADINTALDGLTFNPDAGYNGFDQKQISVDDQGGTGSGGPQITANAVILQVGAVSYDSRLWLSTEADENSSDAPGLGSWTEGQALGFGIPNFSLEPGVTSGSFSPVFNLDNFDAGTNTDINAIHYVSRDITVGGAGGTFDLQIGDLLLSTKDDETLTGRSTISVTKDEVFVFRPDALDDFSNGFFYELLDDFGTLHGDNETLSVTLVEEDTLVGDVTLTAGTFLFSRSGGAEEHHIYEYLSTGVGVGTTTGSVSVLIDGDDIDVSKKVWGIDVMETGDTLGGVSLASGTILMTLDADDSTAGDNLISTDKHDVFYLTVSTTGVGTTAADATLLLEGADVNLDKGAETLDSLTVVPAFPPSLDLDADDSSGETGDDYATTFTEDGGTVLIADVDATITDDDSGLISAITVTITNQLDGASELLWADTSGTSIVAAYNPGTGILDVTGDDLIANYRQVLRTVTYENTSDGPNVTPRLITFTVDDAYRTSNVGTATVAMTAINDAPSLTGGTLTAVAEDTISPPGESVTTIVGGLFSDPDIGSTFAGVAVVGNAANPISQGSWQYSTNGGTNWFDIGTVADDATALAIDTATLLRFVSAGDFNGAPSALVVRGLDDTYAGAFSTTAGSENRENVDTTINGGTTAVAGGTANFNTSITPVNDAATLANLAADTLEYTRGDGVQVIEQGVDASVNDIDSADFDTGNLTVSITAGGDPTEDVLSVRHQGMGAGQIGFVASNVYYSGTLIGTAAGGSGGADLVVTLNASATPTAASALANNITYENTDLVSVTVGARTVEFTLDDGDGDTSLAHAASAVVASSAPPAITDLAGDVLAYAEDDGPQVVDQSAAAAVTDVDSTDFDLGNLTVAVAAGGTPAEDMLSIRDEGIALGQIGFDGANVTYGGTLIGTASGGSGGGDLVVTLNANGTPAATSALVRNITYENTDTAAPTAGARTLRLTVDDGDGGLSTNYDMTVNVTPVNDAPAINLPGGPLNYTENDPATVIDGGATLSDPDSPDFDTGTLTVDFTANGTANDRLEINDQGPGVGNLSLSGSDVRFDFGAGPVVIGTFAGGSGVTPLVITLNANSDDPSVEALMRNITYRNVSEDPSTLSRTVRFVLTDGDGGTSNAETETINVASQNDDPTITSSASTSVAENQTAVLTATTTDPDGGAPTFTLTGGADQALFNLNATSGVLTFATAPDFEIPTDADTDNIYGVQVTADDGNGGTDVQAISVTVTDVVEGNVAPTISLPGVAVNYTENDPATIIDAGAALVDPDSTDFDTGTLTVDFTANGTANDRLAIRDQGPGVGNIGLAGSDVRYDFGVGPIVIGTFAGGTSGFDPLVITLNVSSDDPSVEALMRNITYENVSDNPSTLGRTVRFVLTDGDGGTSNTETETINVTAQNDDPTITSNASPSVAENQTAVLTVTTTDPDGGAPTYSLTGGVDQVRFNINATTGALTFASAPDFELPTDADTNNIYVVQVTADDGNGGTDVQAISVTVTDANDAPIITSSSTPSVAENQTSVLTVTTTDQDVPADTITYSLSGGVDQARFSINASTGVLTFNTAPDFEVPTDADTDNVYEVQVTADDGNGGTDVQLISVTVTDDNDAAVITTTNLNAAENQTNAGTVLATDADLPADTFTWSITGSGADDGLFAINSSTGALTFSTAPDFETPGDANTDNVYEVEVRINDGMVNTTKAITVTVTDANDAPIITSTSTPSVPDGNTAVVTVTATDQDADTQTFTITGGVDQGHFSIGNLTGALAFIAPPSFATPTDSNTDNVYEVQVTADDGNGGTDVQAIYVTVTATRNSPPVITSSATPSVAENQTNVLTVTASDPDLDVPTFSITGGADAGRFSINGSSGVLTFNTAPDFEVPTDADTNNVYEVQVTADDGNGGTDVQAISVTVSTVNDNNPVFTSGNSPSVAENTTAVLTVTATDADLPAQTVTYSFTSGADQGLFSINGATGVLAFIAAPDFEAPTDADLNNIYEVQVTADDGNGGTSSQMINATVTDANEAPVVNNQVFAIAENSLNGTSVGTIAASDPDTADTLTFNIIGGSGSTTFAVNPATGEITVADVAQLDFEANPILTLNVEVRDLGGLIDTAVMTVNLCDANDVPTAVNDPYAVNEDTTLNVAAPAGVLANDTDSESSPLSANLVTGPTNGSLTLNADGSFSYTPSANVNGTDSFTYRASDGVNLSNVAIVSINVNSVNDTPVGNSESYAVDNDAVLTVVAAGVLANDSDVESDPLSAVLVSGPASGTLMFGSDGSFVYTPELTFSGTVTFKYQANDGSGMSNVVAVTIDVNATVGPGAPTSPPDNEPPPNNEPPSETEPPAESETPADGNQQVLGAPPPPSTPSDATPSDEQAAETVEPESALTTDVGLFDYTVEAQAALNRSRATLNEEEIARIELGQGVITVNPFFDTRFYWGRLNEFEQDVSDSTSSFLGMKAGHVAGVTLAFTAGYVVWSIKGGYLMASFLTTLPAWTSMDPIPILDAGSEFTPRKKTKGEITPDDEPLY